MSHSFVVIVFSFNTWYFHLGCYSFLADRSSKKGKGLTLFKDVKGIQGKSGRRGLIFFEDSVVEIEDKNSPKRTYLVNIQLGYVR